VKPKTEVMISRGSPWVRPHGAPHWKGSTGDVYRRHCRYSTASVAYFGVLILIRVGVLGAALLRPYK